MNDRTPPILLTPAPSEPSASTAEAEAAPAMETTEAEAPKAPRLDPTRYGDWEINGKCVDF